MSKTLKKGLRSLLDRIEEIVLRRDFEFAELQGAILAMMWGVWLLLPFYDRPLVTYETLLQVAPNEGWAVLFMAVGFGQMYGLVRQKRRLRRFFTFAALLVWLFTSILIGMNDWHALSFPMACAFALGAGWGFIRIGRLDAVPAVPVKERDFEPSEQPAILRVSGGGGL
jgi:hypothetical protein